MARGPMLWLRLCIALGCLLAPAACEDREVDLRPLAFNAALAKGDNTQLLLNAVRASKRYPLFFTAVSQITSSGPFDGSTFGFTLPFGPINKNNYSANPIIHAQEGMNVTTAPLDTQQFYQGFLQPESFDAWEYYLQYDWDPDLIYYAFIRKIVLSDPVIEAIAAQASLVRIGNLGPASCSGVAPTSAGPGTMPPANTIDAAAELDCFKELLPNYEASRSCGVNNPDLADSITNLRTKDGATFPFTNSPDDYCELLRFQLLLEELKALDFRIIAAPQGNNTPTTQSQVTLPQAAEGNVIQLNVTASSSTSGGGTGAATGGGNVGTGGGNAGQSQGNSSLASGQNAPKFDYFLQLDVDLGNSTSPPTGAPRCYSLGQLLPSSSLPKGARVRTLFPLALQLAQSIKLLHDEQQNPSQASSSHPPSTSSKISSIKDELALISTSTEFSYDICLTQEIPPIVLRSPEGIVFYMGQIIEAAYNPDPKREFLTKLNIKGYNSNRNSGGEYPSIMFLVCSDSSDAPDECKGRGAAGKAAVSADFENETYFIPRPTPDVPGEQSMHLMSLLTQLFVLQKNGAALPFVPTVQIIGQ